MLAVVVVRALSIKIKKKKKNIKKNERTLDFWQVVLVRNQRSLEARRLEKEKGDTEWIVEKKGSRK